MNVRDQSELLPAMGRIEWIGLAGEERGDMRSVQSATVNVGTGFEREHHALDEPTERQVTLIQSEHFAVMSSMLGHEVGPEMTRRNIVVAGVNLTALEDQQFYIGDVLLEWSAPCPPCERMEENLGRGGIRAMIGHGGICARVIEAGTLNVGDAIRTWPLPDVESEDTSTDS